MVSDRNLDFIAMMGNLVFEEENECVRNLEVERLEAERRRQEEERAAAVAEQRRVEEQRRQRQRAEQEAADAEYRKHVARLAEEYKVGEAQWAKLELQREIYIPPTAGTLKQAERMCHECKCNTARIKNLPLSMIRCEAEDGVVRRGGGWCAYFVNRDGFTIPGLRIRSVL